MCLKFSYLGSGSPPGIAVFPDFSIRLRRDDHTRYTAGHERVIAHALVKRSVCRDLVNVGDLGQLIEQGFERFTVRNVIASDAPEQNVARSLVRADRELFPGAVLRPAVLPNFPLTLVVDFDAR